MNSAWCTGRLAAGAAAWAALSAAIWFAGDTLLVLGHRPLEGTAERIGVIVLIGVLWAGWEGLRARNAAKENERLLDGLVAGSLDPDSAQRAAGDLAVLRKRFEEALAVLRKARFRTREGERRTVSQLPWYMFIGAPGSGKTTALLNAGLRFPLGDPRAGEQALQGVGGTRNCDWWFTEQAVLVDTAGRYTTQESDRQADAAAWLGFLDLLKRFRPRQPLNGVIVTLSVADLVHWNEEELGRYAAHVRERIGELYTRLGVRLPIYLMVTKTDLLAGFNEFFSEFDRNRRAQVWGTTFDLTEQARAFGERFEDEFARLERHLYMVLPERLQETRDLQKRAAVYRFPQQFRVSGPLVSRFLERAFGGTWTGDGPYVRGVYFTSGTQEGTPIDRVLGTLARTFNLERKVEPPAATAGKSYFLKRLLHEVVFAESGLAGLDFAAERHRRSMRVTAYGALAVVTLAFASAWTGSFFANAQLISSAQVRTSEAKQALETVKALRAGEEAKLIALLNQLRALRPAVLGDDARLLRVAFYQGDKFGAQAERAYRNALRDVFVAHLAVSLENALRTDPDATLVEGYVSLHDEAKRDARVIERAALRTWKLPDSAGADLGVHLREALAERPLVLPRGRDDALIERARHKV